MIYSKAQPPTAHSKICNVKRKSKSSKLRTNAMCLKIECPTCHKPTWRGCGMHIDAALTGVKEEDRCPNWKTGKHDAPDQHETDA